MLVQGVFFPKAGTKVQISKKCKKKVRQETGKKILAHRSNFGQGQIGRMKKWPDKDKKGNREINKERKKELLKNNLEQQR